MAQLFSQLPDGNASSGYDVVQGKFGVYQFTTPDDGPLEATTTGSWTRMCLTQPSTRKVLISSYPIKDDEGKYHEDDLPHLDEMYFFQCSRKPGTLKAWRWTGNMAFSILENETGVTLADLMELGERGWKSEDGWSWCFTWVT